MVGKMHSPDSVLYLFIIQTVRFRYALSFACITADLFPLGFRACELGGREGIRLEGVQTQRARSLGHARAVAGLRRHHLLLLLLSLAAYHRLQGLLENRGQTVTLPS